MSVNGTWKIHSLHFWLLCTFFTVCATIQPVLTQIIWSVGLPVSVLPHDMIPNNLKGSINSHPLWMYKHLPFKLK